MALAFVRASGQYAEAAGNPLGAPAVSVFTIACWYKPSSIANGTAFGIGDTNSTEYLALGMNGSGDAFVELGGQTATAGALTNGAWNFIAGVQSGATNRVAYLGASPGAANTTSKDFTAADTITAGGLMLNGSRLSFAGGSVAHCAVWSSALSAGNITSLAGGARPDAVSPGTLVFYAELDGAGSPEEDLVGALDLVWGAGGAAPTQDTDNPPVGGTVVERSAAVSTTTAIATAPQRELLRQAAVSTTTSIATAGTFWSILERSTALSATTGIATIPQRELHRSVALSAALAITISRPFGWLESAGGVSGLEASGGVSGLIE